jgi:hypothetical protein
MKLLLSCFILLGVIENGRAVSSLLPFTERFDLGSSNWLNGSSAVPNYSSTGGVANTGYVFTSATIDTSGFGPIVFRGNNANSASGGAFVGNWLAAGVNQFSAYVWHNAPVDLNFYVRFDKGAGSAASSNMITVAANTWTLLNIPIVDSLGLSGQVFQSYGAVGSGGFNTIFSDIKNVQIALAATQDARTSGQTYTVGLDSASVIPEPSVGVMTVVGLFGLGLLRRRAVK